MNTKGLRDTEGRLNLEELRRKAIEAKALAEKIREETLNKTTFKSGTALSSALQKSETELFCDAVLQLLEERGKIKEFVEEVSRGPYRSLENLITNKARQILKEISDD